MTPKTIIFMGPQGSGKGTQVELLMQRLAEGGDQPVVDVQTGRLFRNLAQSDLYVSQRVKEINEAGELAPDNFISALWINDLKERLTADAHLLLDGVPRTMQQATIVDEMMVFFARDGVQIINLDVPQDVVVARMLDRGRADDTPDAIKTRLDLYQNDTLPVLDHYREKADVTVHDINGAQSLQDVHADICAAVGV